MNELATYLPSLFGGFLIGLSALVLYISLGRIAGISGILAGVISKSSENDKSWRILFIIGLVIGVGIFQLVNPVEIPFRESPSIFLLLTSGFLVGVGTFVGSGCTSGHGVCGIGRFSFRSIIATVTFMLTAGITVYVVNHIVT